MSPNRYILKSVWKNAISLLICASLLPLGDATIYAGTWRDSFDDGTLDGWKPNTRGSVEGGFYLQWEETAGRLEVRLADIPLDNLFVARLFKLAAGILELTAIELDEEHLIVEAISIKGKFLGFGIAIGKRSSRTHSLGIVYHFRTWGSITKNGLGRTGGWSGVKPPPIDYVNPKKPVESQIEHMKVVFDTGRFQFFSADRLVAELVDPEYKTVNLVGLMVWGEALKRSGSLDEFVISGPGIPSLWPTNKLATTWGALKTRAQTFRAP